MGSWSLRMFRELLAVCALVLRALRCGGAECRCSWGFLLSVLRLHLCPHREYSHALHPEEQNQV